MEQSILEMVDAAIEMGIVKKGRSIGQSELMMYALAALIALGFAFVLLFRCCCGSKKAKGAKAE
eukprot:2706871-Rhodomonas_salina.1